jgi:hypothetical protein
MSPPGQQAHSYGFLVYGSQSGYQNTRAQIELNGSTGQTIAFLRFCDPGMTFPADTFNNGIVDMYLPVSMLESMLTRFFELRRLSPCTSRWDVVFYSPRIEPLAEDDFAPRSASSPPRSPI